MVLRAATAAAGAHGLDAAGGADDDVRRLILERRFLLHNICSAKDDHHLDIRLVGTEALKLVRDLWKCDSASGWRSEWRKVSRDGARQPFLWRERAWYASSRVWHMISALTSLLEISSCCSREMTNTAVFPIPDFAWQITSMPRIACGMHSC